MIREDFSEEMMSELRAGWEEGASLHERPGYFQTKSMASGKVLRWAWHFFWMPRRPVGLGHGEQRAKWPEVRSERRQEPGHVRPCGPQPGCFCTHCRHFHGRQSSPSYKKYIFSRETGSLRGPGLGKWVFCIASWIVHQICCTRLLKTPQ